MTTYVYYRSYSKKLCLIAVDGVEPDEAVDAVRDNLKQDGELFHEPLIAVLKGGNHGL